MMWRFAVLLWFVLPSIGSAQITVRTGEHDDFTRIVLTIPPSTEWKVGRLERGYGIMFADLNEIDTTGFFDRIPQDRVTDVSVDATRGLLSLDVDCECSADAFLWRPDKLVVDIRDGAADTSGQFEIVLFDDLVGSDILAEDLASVMPSRPLPRVIENVPDELQVSPLFVRDLTPAKQIENQESITALEGLITENLNLAASQGLVDFTTNAQETGTEIQMPSTDTVHSVGVRVQSSIEDALIQSTPENVTQGGVTCFAGGSFQLHEWGGDGTFSEQIGGLRAHITQEFDELDPADVEKLARTYLYFGFGREAIQVLQIDQRRSQLRLHLRTIAQIIDDDIVSDNLPSDQMSCENDVAFWAFIGEETRDLTVDVNVGSVLRTFRALPLHLQLHLGPRLSEKFVSINNFDAAAQALTNSQREIEVSPESVIVQARLDTANGNETTAIVELEKLASTDSRITPEAILDLFRLNLLEGLETNPDLLKLSEALRFENTGEAIVGSLAIAEVEILLTQGKYARAQNLLSGEKDAIGSVNVDLLKDKFAFAITNEGSDADFVEYAFQNVEYIISQEAKNAIASRLLDTGFPEQAAKFVTDAIPGPAMAEQRYLMAEVQVALNEPEKAIATLSSTFSERANNIRSEAEARMSGFSTLENNEGNDGVARSQLASDWRSGNWQALSDSDDALLLATSNLVLTEDLTTETPDSPLADGRKLLTQSTETRDTLTNLLDRYVVDTDAVFPVDGWLLNSN